jgi:xanthine dehydrogenase YagS FAD-binding subunit
MLAQALLLGASPQLRHMASMGGNLLQRVRCSYFRDARSPCNKREPGSGCAALEGINRGHAILGTSEQCIATHPSDAAVALVALDAIVHTEGPRGARAIPIDDFFLLPGDTPHREHPLDHGELIVAIVVPGLPMARTSLYLKVRDRESYEFALASVAAALHVDDEVISDVRLALGGVATKPGRARRAEQMLVGAPAERASFARAAREELAPAVPRTMNGFKVELAQRAIVRALEMATLIGGAA